MRWNPVLRQWSVVATHRQDRTYLPAQADCPFCPTADPEKPTEVPAPDFQIVAFANRFSSFTPDPLLPDVGEDDLYHARPAQGACELIVYTPEHGSSVSRLSVYRIRNLIDVWTDRYDELGALGYVDYVFIFENKGEAVGVTLHHPHGQLYAFPYVPPIVERELVSAREHETRTGRCLFCDILAREVSDESRVVYENERALAFVPYYARWPYEVHVFPRRHTTSLSNLGGDERQDMARALKAVTAKYDNLFGFPLPYVMLVRQRPTDGEDHGYYHMHFEFYPANRAHDKLKHLAGVEVGAGTFLLDAAPEDKAAELRALPPHGV
jgi:UDPglucose--hexose-1-phosphate uridylyltransferase